jgi:hypothetical protein
MKLILTTVYEDFDDAFLELYFSRPFPDGPRQVVERLKNGERKAGFTGPLGPGIKGKATTTYELVRDNDVN